MNSHSLLVVKSCTGSNMGHKNGLCKGMRARVSSMRWPMAGDDDARFRRSKRERQSYPMRERCVIDQIYKSYICSCNSQIINHNSHVSYNQISNILRLGLFGSAESSRDPRLFRG